MSDGSSTPSSFSATASSSLTQGTAEERRAKIREQLRQQQGKGAAGQALANAVRANSLDSLYGVSSPVSSTSTIATPSGAATPLASAANTNNSGYVTAAMQLVSRARQGSAITLPSSVNSPRTEISSPSNSASALDFHPPPLNKPEPPPPTHRPPPPPTEMFSATFGRPKPNSNISSLSSSTTSLPDANQPQSSVPTKQPKNALPPGTGSMDNLFDSLTEDIDRAIAATSPKQSLAEPEMLLFKGRTDSRSRPPPVPENGSADKAAEAGTDIRKEKGWRNSEKPKRRESPGQKDSRRLSMEPVASFIKDRAGSFLGRENVEKSGRSPSPRNDGESSPSESKRNRGSKSSRARANSDITHSKPKQTVEPEQGPDAVPPSFIDESVIVPEYVAALRHTLRADTTISPDPSEFLSMEGYQLWLDSHGGSLQSVLAELLEARYLNLQGSIYRSIEKARNRSIKSRPSSKYGPSSGGRSHTESVDRLSLPSMPAKSLFFQVNQAQGLVVKPGKVREVYCVIEYMHAPDEHAPAPSGPRFFSSNSGSTSQKREVFMTESIKVDGYNSGHEPELVTWNQHVEVVTTRPWLETITVRVWDRKKGYFMGQAELSVGELLDAGKWGAGEGEFVTTWVPLTNKKGKKEVGGKEKYIGGEILIGFGLVGEEEQYKRSALESFHPDIPLRSENPESFLYALLVSSRVNLKLLYKSLLRACLSLDMDTLEMQLTETSEELLTLESRTLLDVFGGTRETAAKAAQVAGRVLSGIDAEEGELGEIDDSLAGGAGWDVGDAFQVISYVNLLFEKYQAYEVPTGAMKAAYYVLRRCLKQRDLWLPKEEEPSLVSLLDRMHTYFSSQVSNYKEYYPHNAATSSAPLATSNGMKHFSATGLDALKTTLFMLRMINKEPLYREHAASLPSSFREELRSLMTEAALVRFQKFCNLTAPLDEGDARGVVDGFLRLADLIADDVDADEKFYEKAFHRELSITQLVGEVFFKYFVINLETQVDILASESAVTEAADNVFSLFRRVATLEEKFARLNVKTMGISLENWFSPFLRKWLVHMSSKTIEWVSNAVRADKFEFVNIPSEEQRAGGTMAGLLHSSSVTDLFSVIFQEMDILLGVKWRDPVQSASCLQAFAKTVYTAIDQYCYALMIGENGADQGAVTNPGWAALTSLRTTAPREPQDIQHKTCVKLSNMEYALVKLAEMFKLMNIAGASQLIRDHRKSIFDTRKFSKSRNAADNDDDFVKGGFFIQIAYAEDIKSCNKNGLANPYCLVRVPDGTVLPPEFGNYDTNAGPAVPIVLTGRDCELLRTRTTYDTVNPQWDESFHAMLPPVDRLEILVCSRNMITMDEIAGRAEVPLTGRAGRTRGLSGEDDANAQIAATGTKMRSLLSDHQTHDVSVELEPQGRVLLRLNMDGEDEDGEFWFRKSRERLWRTRDDFVRSLASKITPYCREVIVKAIKSHEGVPFAGNKSILQSIASASTYATGLQSGSSSAANSPSLPGRSLYTSSGISIELPVTSAEADMAMFPLTDYLNKNLETLCLSLSSRMAQIVITRIWDECLSIAEYTLVPPLYGQIERDRRFLNSRQITLVDYVVRILCDFFHADGQGLGIPMKTLTTDNTRYKRVIALLGSYHDPDLGRLRREYEDSLTSRTLGRSVGSMGSDNPQGFDEKEWLLRLLRLRFEKQEDLSVFEREEGRRWFEIQLVKRRLVKQNILLE
ncbi:hypothetical protein BJ742DRAFT_765530 [Cladochytrium replicatum]|nr:hypothetical protein BJ742DRAFT_765530 [Cladochytrium replicatum]